MGLFINAKLAQTERPVFIKLKGNSALEKVLYFIALIDSCYEIRNFGEESR